MDLDYLKASDGTGKAILAHIQSDRAPAATVIDVDSVDNFPNKFILTTGTLNASGFIIESTMLEMKCHLNAGDIIIDSFEPGYVDVGNEDGQVAIIKQTTGWANLVQQAVSGVVTDTANFIATQGDWRTLPAINSVVYNGNRNYTITYASTIAALLSPYSRLRVDRTVAAPTYMGGLFNGTTQYFTKVTPTSTLSTVTNNFSIVGWVEPTAYGTGAIAARMDNTAANGLALRTNASGNVEILVNNAGAGNFRFVSTVATLLPGKKYHVIMTWASGTVTAYLDGVAVPVQVATTGGTAPTTAGTGGDFSIGRLGAFNGNYYTGYISGVQVYNAVLTATEARALYSQAATGSETNCIGSWTLNNTGVNQQAAGTNDLTATAGVGYTLRSPFCNDSSGVAGTYDYGMVNKIISSTVVNVQVPMGCTIPTTGGVTSSSYGIGLAPFGFPAQAGLWSIEQVMRINSPAAVPVVNVWTNKNGKITTPIGRWTPSIQGVVAVATSGSAAHSPYVTLSTGAATQGTSDMTRRVYYLAQFSGTTLGSYNIEGDDIDLSAMTDYYRNLSVDSATLVTDMLDWGASGHLVIKMKPAGI